jgi:hypothetical protein
VCGGIFFKWHIAFQENLGSGRMRMYGNACPVGTGTGTGTGTGRVLKFFKNNVFKDCVK